MAQRTFGALDGLRCISIVAVVWHHIPVTTNDSVLAGRGFLGVDLFFVISGYLIATLLLRERDRLGDISLSAFYMRRSLRIFPLYYGFLFALGASFALFAADSEAGSQFFAEWPIYVTYTGNWVEPGWMIVWSLAAEEQFYLVWPHIEKRLARFFVPVMSVALLVNQAFNFPASRDAISAFLDWPGLAELSIMQITFTPILLGVVLAHVMHDPIYFERVSWLLRSRRAPLVWLAFILLLAVLPNSDISGIHRLTLQLSMTGLVASSVYQEDHLLMPFLSWPPIVRIGTISYGIYIFHIHMITVVDRILHRLDFANTILFLLLSLLMSIAVAELSFRFYETPFLRLKKHFARRAVS